MKLYIHIWSHGFNSFINLHYLEVGRICLVPSLNLQTALGINGKSDFDSGLSLSCFWEIVDCEFAKESAIFYEIRVAFV